MMTICSNWKDFLLAFVFMLIISCQTKNENASHTREMLPNPEKYEHDNYSPGKITFKPDTSINSVSLLSSKNIENYFGKDITEKINHETISPKVVVLSNDGKKSLIMYFHHGNLKNEFSEFEVIYTKGSFSNSNIIVNDNEFKTESGIKLGMTVGELKSIKGEPDVVFKKDNYLIYGYEIKDLKSSEFLKKYKMPEYYSDYSFINGYLEKFRFGFEYR
jgi:hypothetical protein